MSPGQITKNCHYVSRFLTKPWEADHRQLHVFDFDEDAFVRGSSRTMFSENEINTQDVEDWLNRVIERPFAACRPRLASGDMGALDDPASFRAATLIVWLQGLRVRAIDDHDARRELSRLAATPLAEIDTIVAAIVAEYDVQLVVTVREGTMFAPLFVPSTGIFQLTYPDEGCSSGNAVAIGLPIDIHCALMLTPKERDGQRDLSRFPGSLANVSVGTTPARRVAVPPALFDPAQTARLRDVLHELRDANNFLVDAVREAQDLVVEAFSQVGLAAQRDTSGRVIPSRR